MNLTSEEAKYAKNYILNLEKVGRFWPWFRWILLVSSIIIIGIWIYNIILFEKVLDAMSSSFSVPKDYNSNKIQLFVKGQVASLRTEIFFLPRMTFDALLGVVLFIYCLRNWKRHVKAGILAKTLKTLLSEEPPR